MNKQKTYSHIFNINSVCGPCLDVQVCGGGDDASGDDKDVLQADEGHGIGHQVHVPAPTQALTYTATVLLCSPG